MKFKYLIVIFANILILENLPAMDSSKRKEIISYSSRRKKQKTELVAPVRQLSLFERSPLDVQRLIIDKVLTSSLQGSPSFAERLNPKFGNFQNIHALRQLRVANKYFNTLINSEAIAKKIILTSYYLLSTINGINDGRLNSIRALTEQLFKPGNESTQLEEWLKNKDSEQKQEEDLRKAAFEGNVEIVREFFQNGIDVNARGFGYHPRNNNKKFIWHSTWHALDCAQRKLESLEDNFMVLTTGDQPMGRVAQGWGKAVLAQKRIIELLKKHGADEAHWARKRLYWTLHVPELILQLENINEHIQTLSGLRLEFKIEAEKNGHLFS